VQPSAAAAVTPRHSRPDGWLEVNPAFAPGLTALGIESPGAFLDLFGEIVSGHPDRHVVSVRLAGFSIGFFLKRQHRVGWRERFRNWRDGFGWLSRCEREWHVLRRLAALDLPGPRWVAVGEDNCGRAFLMVEEAADTVDLRRFLDGPSLAKRDRARFADRLGRLIARLHTSGFTTPDLTAKHLLVSAGSREITPIDWQSARCRPAVALTERVRALAALHASVVPDLATPRERLRVLRAALLPARRDGSLRRRSSEVARRVEAEAARLAGRRSIRDQRGSPAADTRLVWLAGEAVCAVPGVAANWPEPAVTAPYYGGEPGAFAIRLRDGTPAHLIRGRSFSPFGRLAARLRGKSWRSPGATIGRVLFHLQRFGVPAPQLLAFGQRFTGPTTAEWFALHTPPAPPVESVSGATAGGLGQCLRRVHDAGCRPAGDPLAVFGRDSRVAVRDVTAIRLVRRLTDRDRSRDLNALLAALEPGLRTAAAAGYALPTESPSVVSRRPVPTGVTG
jgi:hypothetical protein